MRTAIVKVDTICFLRDSSVNGVNVMIVSGHTVTRNAFVTVNGVNSNELTIVETRTRRFLFAFSEDIV